MLLSRLLSKPLRWWLKAPVSAVGSITQRLHVEERLHSLKKRPSLREKELITHLRSDFAKLAPLELESVSAAGREWNLNRLALRQQVAKRDPRGFLRWDVVKHTMVTGNEPYIGHELNFLQGRSNWKTRWEPLIQEDWIGRPLPSPLAPSSSANRIHHAYHLARFEEAFHLSIEHFDSILEFGAGYGNFRRLCGVLAPQARYFAFDFPEWGALQKYYLSHFDASTASVFSFDSAEAEPFLAAAKKPLLVATWSLSESPLEVRSWVEANLGSFAGILIAFQAGFNEVDNMSYFQKWVESFPKFKWIQEPISHLPSNFYLMGYRL